MKPLPAVTHLLILVCLLSSSVSALEAVPARATVGTQSRQSLLNSSRIRARFGNYGIDVLEQDSQVRVSRLYSREQGEKITRTLAVVIYAGDIAPEILAEHQSIVAGGSIGEVFENSGWGVEKVTRYLGEIPASLDCAEIYALMGGIQPVGLATQVYELCVCKAGQCMAYATIAEVHHPDYFDQAQLQEIWNPENVPANPNRAEVEGLMNAVKQQLTRIAH